MKYLLSALIFWAPFMILFHQFNIKFWPAFWATLCCMVIIFFILLIINGLVNDAIKDIHKVQKEKEQENED